MSGWSIVKTVPIKWGNIYEYRITGDDFVFLSCRNVSARLPRDYCRHDAKVVARAFEKVLNARHSNPPRQRLMFLLREDGDRWYGILQCGHTTWKRAKFRPKSVRCEACKRANSILDIPDTILQAHKGL